MIAVQSKVVKGCHPTNKNSFCNTHDLCLIGFASILANFFPFGHRNSRTLENPSQVFSVPIGKGQIDDDFS